MALKAVVGQSKFAMFLLKLCLIMKNFIKIMTWKCGTLFQHHFYPIFLWQNVSVMDEISFESRVYFCCNFFLVCRLPQDPPTSHTLLPSQNNMNLLKPFSTNTMGMCPQQSRLNKVTDWLSNPALYLQTPSKKKKTIK